MEILVLKGSSNKNGSSNLHADNFIKGAIEAGHEVSEIDAAHADISPCMGVLAAIMKGNAC